MYPRLYPQQTIPKAQAQRLQWQIVKPLHVLTYPAGINEQMDVGILFIDKILGWQKWRVRLTHASKKQVPGHVVASLRGEI